MNENPTSAREQYELGFAYHGGRGVPQDFEKAHHWYLKAAEQNNTDAMEILAILYAHGTGCLRDDTRTDYWYAKAAEQYAKDIEQGSIDAVYKLGKLYENGRGVPQNTKKAIDCFLRAAELGNASAQCRLGYAFHHGPSYSSRPGDEPWGFPQDYKEAAKWFALAAKQGDSYGQSNLGDCYASGEGVDKDLKVANELYAKSAEQGNAWAQYELGLNYSDGKGIQKDLEKAKYWITLAAEQEHEDAQKALAKLNAGKSPRGACYVATYVYGSYDCPEVRTLRRFRDETLSQSWIGRMFIGIYYAASPILVKILGGTKCFSKLCKFFIDILLTRLQKNDILKS